MKRDKLLIIIIILGVVILAIFSFSYYFYSNMKSIGNNLQDLSEKSAEEVLIKEEIKNLNISTSVLKPQIEEINSLFISPQGQVSFIDEVESLAKYLDLKIEINSVDIDSNEVVSGQGLAILKMKVTVVGTWVGNYKFLYYLENLPYSIDIRQMSLSNLSDSSQKISTDIWRGIFDIKVLQKADK